MSAVASSTTPRSQLAAQVLTMRWAAGAMSAVRLIPRGTQVQVASSRRETVTERARERAREPLRGGLLLLGGGEGRMRAERERERERDKGVWLLGTGRNENGPRAMRRVHCRTATECPVCCVESVRRRPGRALARAATLKSQKRKDKRQLGGPEGGRARTREIESEACGRFFFTV